MNSHSNPFNIRWHPPEPRSGLAGMLDKFIGPGATSAEILLQILPSLMASVAILIYAGHLKLNWSFSQQVIAAVLAFDVVGGVITNATNSAKRWYHRKEQKFKQHFFFIMTHALQIFLVAWLFRNHDWVYFIGWYGYLLVAACIILRVPLYLQRPFALLLYTGAILLDNYAALPVAGMEWFIPLFFLKLLISHLLIEAPYH